jgi:hypothetical protein
VFIVQGVIRITGDPAAVRKNDEYYDGLLHETEGMYWNMYLEGADDPTLTIHTQDWKEQATSEAFGISPGFQKLRTMGSPGGKPQINVEGPLSPGYWRPVRNFEYSAPPTGYDKSKLGAASQSIVWVIPGKEAEYVAAETRIGERLASIDGAFWFRYYHNLGSPNAYSRIIHWRDLDAAKAGIASLGDAEAARQTLIQEERGGLFRVKLFSDWPERRARDGM